MCLTNIVNIANTCIDHQYWPNHFKELTSIIIPKPNKVLYNSPEMFHPIVLLNILGKLIEKVIGEHLQFHAISNNFEQFHPSQSIRRTQIIVYYRCWYLSYLSYSFRMGKCYKTLGH